MITTRASATGDEGRFVLDGVTTYSGLPPLAWLAEVTGRRVKLCCGACVERSEGSFFEGCWAGDYTELDFDTAENVFGSGGKIAHGQLRFVTPSHTLDAVYALEAGGKCFVSNSLSFLVEYTDLQLPYDRTLGARFASVARGLDDYDRLLFEGKKWKLYRIVYENIEIKDGRVVIHRPPSGPPPFRTFAQYKDYLVSTLRRALDNAASQQRRVRFCECITTCSSGYDSSACAALAAELGCKTAFTVRKAGDGKGKGKEDSGRLVAQKLGLGVREFQPVWESKREGSPEVEFLATGMGGEDCAFAAFVNLLSNKILFTGFHGDKIWDINVAATASIVRGDISGSSFSENRLRVGYIHIPVPFIGCVRHDDILRVSKSPEMAAHRVGGTYDRPIPRRIVEDAGVPRQYFGQSKKAASVNVYFRGSAWPEDSFTRLRQFERDWLSRGGLKHSRYLMEIWSFRMRRVAYGIPSKITSWTGVKWPRRLASKVVDGDVRTFVHRHPRYGNLAFLWALQLNRARYRLVKEAPQDHAA